MGRTVNHGDPIGRAERHERRLSIARDADPDCLDGFLPQSRYVEGDLLLHLVLHGVDDAHGSTDFRRNPDFGGVALEFGETGARIDEHVRHDLAGRGIDEMRHIARFRRVDEDLPVRTEYHSLRLDPDLHLAQWNAPFQVDHRDRVVVLVGHVENLYGWIL